MSEQERVSLRKPGWLPTAIIANIVPKGDSRAGKLVADEDAVRVTKSGDSPIASIGLPSSWTPTGWRPEGAYPLEIIDGQHRLSAFTSDDDSDFELPVVLFEGLDFSWQAYLFWTVNIKPKRINASLAFDLYPLLREQDWLEAGESLSVYRETRAQELTEALWAEPESIWYDRINMLGQTGMRAARPVTQAAFVRSLTTTFVRPFKGHHGLGGLFGGAADNTGLNWGRGQQAGFLIFAWSALANAITAREADWARSLRGGSEDGALLVEHSEPTHDPAVVGEGSLLASDQGVRGVHMIVNDLVYVSRQSLGLEQWLANESPEDSADLQMREALEALETNEAGAFLRELGECLASFDWRNSKVSTLTPEQRLAKQALRGTSGYNVLRDMLLQWLKDAPIDRVAEAASVVWDARNA